MKITKKLFTTGAERVKRKFAVIPRRVDEKTVVWLEYVWLHQVFSGRGTWFTTKCESNEQYILRKLSGKDK